MDDLIKWEPRDNQHLTARITRMTVPWRGIGKRTLPCCSLCGYPVPRRDYKYCGHCGARLKW